MRTTSKGESEKMGNPRRFQGFWHDMKSAGGPDESGEGVLYF